MNNQAARIVKIFCAAFLLALLTAPVAEAQEKSFVWVSLPKQLSISSCSSSPPLAQEWFDQDNAVLYRSHALELIQATIGAVPEEATTSDTQPSALPAASSTTPTGTTSSTSTATPPIATSANSSSTSSTAPTAAKSAPHLRTCKPTEKPAFPGAKDNKEYFVIHVLRWKDPVGNSQSVDKQNWYVFHVGKDGKVDPYWDDDAYAKNNRIFGSRNIYFLYVHFNVKSTYLARYTMTAKKKTPAYLLHFASLLQLYGVNDKSGGGGEVVGAVWGATILDTYYVPSDSTFAPTMLPRPSGPGPAAASTAAGQAGTPPSASQQAPSVAPSTTSPPTVPPASTAPSTATTPPQTPPVPPAGTSSNLPPTSLTVPTANSPSTSPANPSANPSASSSQPASIPTEVKLDSQTFDNEDRYHLDFSVAVPIRKISEISLVSSSNTLVPTKIDKQTTFGVVDYYFKPIDLKGSGWSLYPHALAGVAIDSHPLKRVLIGGGYGPLLAHFYLGLVLDTQSLPPGASCGKIPSSQQLASGKLQNHICPGVSLGLNVSVGSVLDSLKSKSSTGSASKSK